MQSLSFSFQRFTWPAKQSGSHFDDNWVNDLGVADALIAPVFVALFPQLWHNVATESVSRLLVLAHSDLTEIIVMRKV